MPANLDDDAVQRRFHRDSAYVAAYEREYELLRKAVLATNAVERRRYASESLDMARARRERFFVGSDLMYRELEDLFLYVEGSGGWAFFQVARSRLPATTTLAEALEKFKGSQRYWVQEEGGLLFLLIDAEVPDWKGRAFSQQPVSVFNLWAEAAGVAVRN